jgi:hypothetical protein
MDPKILALIFATVVLLCLAAVRSDRELTKEAKEKRSKQFDSHGHE